VVFLFENPTKFDEGNFKGLKFSRRSLVDSKGSKDEYFFSKSLLTSSERLLLPLLFDDYF
jgi:hypothetical protein